MKLFRLTYDHKDTCYKYEVEARNKHKAYTEVISMLTRTFKESMSYGDYKMASRVTEAIDHRRSRGFWPKGFTFKQLK